MCENNGCDQGTGNPANGDHKRAGDEGKQVLTVFPPPKTDLYFNPGPKPVLNGRHRVRGSARTWGADSS